MSNSEPTAKINRARIKNFKKLVFSIFFTFLTTLIRLKPFFGSSSPHPKPPELQAPAPPAPAVDLLGDGDASPAPAQATKVSPPPAATQARRVEAPKVTGGSKQRKGVFGLSKIYNLKRPKKDLKDDSKSTYSTNCSTFESLQTAGKLTVQLVLPSGPEQVL